MQPIYVFPDAFSSAQTQRFRSLADSHGFTATGRHYPPRYRNNDRVVMDDPALAAELLETIRGRIPATLTTADGIQWQLAGLNNRFRFCRYRDGQSFGVHRDGVFHRDAQSRSLLTFMIYLNDAAEFDGGHTRFYNGPDPASGLLMSMAPKRGTLIVFDHALWHDGAPVTGGTKYVMRSDVVYERVTHATGADTGHLGYVWALAPLDDGRIASAGRDGSVRLWSTDGPALCQVDRLPDHAGSVSALGQAAAGHLWTGTRMGELRVHAGGEVIAVHRPKSGAVLRLRPLTADRVAIATASGTVEVWTPSGRDTAFHAHAGWAWDVLPLPGGDLVTAGDDGRIRRWRSDGMAIATLCEAGAAARSLARLDDGTLAAGCGDGTLILIPTVGPARAITAHRGAIRAITQTGDGTLVTAGEDCRIHRWQVSDLAWRHTDTHDDFVTSLIALPDGGVVSSGYDGQLRRWPATETRPAAQSARGRTRTPPRLPPACENTAQ